MNWYVSTLPCAEPVSLDEMKLHLRIDGTDEDTLITSLIQAARSYCEDYQARAYISQTLTLKLNDFPVTDSIRLPRPPLVSVDSITYVDNNGATQTVSSSVYTVDTVSEPGYVYLSYNQNWPYDVRLIPNAVTITYKAGYATPFTFNATSDVITTSGRVFSNGDIVRVSMSGSNTAALPTNLAVNTDYYVISASGSTFKLSTSLGGSAIDLVAASTAGTYFIGEVPAGIKAAMKLIVGHLYENREDSIDKSLANIPMGAKALLGMNKVWNT